MNSNRSISLDTFGFTRLKDAIAIRPPAAQRPSKNIRSDEDLSGEETLDAKNITPHFMAKYNWPLAHAKPLAAFFVAMELHPRRLQPNGKKALLGYQSEVRRRRFDNFDSLKANEGFNIQIFHEDLLRFLAETVNDDIREMEMEQVRLPPSQAPRPAAKRTFLSPPQYPAVSWPAVPLCCSPCASRLAVPPMPACAA